MQVPTGFRFNPTDEELIEILNQKVVSGNNGAAFDFILERNLYELEPQDLQWNIGSVASLNNNERYYYCKRASDSREVAGRGWWKATSHVKTISANAAGVMGYKRPLTFHRFRGNQSKRKDAIKTDWIMHEYGLHSVPTEWRLCKIKYKGKERLEEEQEEETRETIGAAGGSSSMQSQLENQYAFEEQQPLLPPILPSNNDGYEIESYFWSNSSPCDQYPSLINSAQPLLAPSHQYFASQQDNHQSAEPMDQSPFPDLWSGW